MKTRGELRTEFYNALNTALSGTADVYWLGNETKKPYPQVVYKFFDQSGEYSQGKVLSAETIIFQVDIYVDNSSDMDAIYELIKGALVPLCYRNINGPIEFIDESTTKIIRPIRWEKINV